jgi:hypothetical protein
MRAYVACLLAVAAVAILAPAVRAERSWQIIPQVGLNAATLASEPDSLTSSAKVGYMLGGALRFGHRFFVQPGVFYQRTTVTTKSVDEITIEDFEDDLGVGSVWIPLQLGLNIINGSTLDLHVNAGPTGTIVTSVDDNALGLTADDYEDVIWGAVLGAGVDFTLLSLDVSYEVGLSNMLKTGDSDTKQNAFRLCAGLRW